MVRYEPPSFTARCLPSLSSLTSRCLPFYMGLRRPFRPKILRLLLAVAFWIIMFGWMVVSGKLAAMRAPKDTSTLPDLLFSILPEHKLYPLPDILLYVLLTSVIGRIIFHSDGVAIARRFAAISGCVYMIRSVVLLATSFPNPQLQCTNYTPTWGFSSLKSCADMTGHIVNMCLAALCWGQYTKHIFVAATAWLFVLSGMIAVIVSRSNYTVDVLISFLSALYCWKYYHLTLRLPPEHRNRIVRWLEKGSGAVIENQNLETGSPVPGKFVELEESMNMNSPVSTRYQELNDSKPSSPIASRFVELTGAPGPSYKELSCVVK